jgi:hypothetical protein
MNRKNKLGETFAIKIKVKARHLDRRFPFPHKSTSSRPERSGVERPLYFAVAIACSPRPNPESVILSAARSAKSKDLRLPLSLQYPPEAT